MFIRPIVAQMISIAQFYITTDKLFSIAGWKVRKSKCFQDSISQNMVSV